MHNIHNQVPISVFYFYFFLLIKLFTCMYNLLTYNTKYIMDTPKSDG